MSRAVDRVRAIIGTGRRRVIVVAVVLLVGVGGIAFAAGLLGVPAVVEVDNRFADVDESTTHIETDLTVSNPNPLGLNLSGLTIDYTVWLSDVPIASGVKQGVSVGAGNSTLAFRTAMANERIVPWWVNHIGNGERSTMRVDAKVTSGLLGRTVAVTPVERPIETDILSGFNSTETRPVNANSPLVSDPVLYVNETWATWGEVSTSTTPMDMAFVVYNPKPAPYAITEIRYTITMNGVGVGEGATAREYVIPSGTVRTIEATTVIRNARLDEWWVSHLRNDQVTALRIDFAATVELPSGQTVEVPLDPLTYTETIETDFFGNKAGSSGDGPGDSNGNDGGASESTDASGSTDTGTATGTNAPTPTPTPTPDGGGLPIGTETDTDVL